MEKGTLANCEDGAAPVPRLVFKSVFTWLWYEAIRSYVFRIGMIWIGGLCAVCYLVDFAKHDQWVLITFIVVSILSPIVMILFHGLHRGRKTNRLALQNIKVLTEAVETIFTPGLEVGQGQWDAVAAKMNYFLYTEGLWKTPYCFFEGQWCEMLFRMFVLKPNFEKNSQDKFESMDLCEKEYVSAAAEFYQQKIEEQFNAWASESELSHDVPERALPRDLHWNRITWGLNIIAKNCKLEIVLWLFYSFVLSHGIYSFLFIFLSQIFLMSLMSSRKMHLFGISPRTTSYRIRYLATIVNVAPGKDLERWDIVAKRVNSYLFCPESRFLAQDCFYDGKDCMKCFEKHFKPLASQKSKKDNFATYELVPLVSKAIDACS